MVIIEMLGLIDLSLILDMLQTDSFNKFKAKEGGHDA